MERYIEKVNILAEKSQEIAYQKLFLLLLGRLVVETTGLNDLVINVKFVPRSLVHGFFHTLLGNETQDKHGFGLTNSMSTILGL